MGRASESMMRNVTVVLYEPETARVRSVIRTRPELVAEETAKPEFSGLEAVTIMFPLVAPKGRWVVDIKKATTAKKSGDLIFWSDVMVPISQEKN